MSEQSPVIVKILAAAQAHAEEAARCSASRRDTEELPRLWEVVSQSWPLVWLTLHRAGENRYRGALPWGDSALVSALPEYDPIRCAGVDGSQVYSREECPVLFGWIQSLAYLPGEGVMGSIGKDVSELLTSSPDDFHFHRSLIDAERAVLELDVAAEAAGRLAGEETVAVLMDGSLIPWSSVNSSGSGAAPVIKRYGARLASCTGKLLASVISEPKSRAVVNLARLAEARGYENYLPATTGVRDRDLFGYLLANYARSPLFISGSANNHLLSEMRACVLFFYLRIDRQILRVEVPEWVAQDEDALNILHASLVKESLALGFPYCLAKAHQQVVIDMPTADAIYSRAEIAYHSAGGIPTGFSAKNLAKGLAHHD